MKALLHAVGFERADGWASSGPKLERSTSSDGLGRGWAVETGPLNIASVAAATERSVVALQQEARTLEKSSLEDTHGLLSRWVQQLRKKSKGDDLVSFKARFLRSSALEKSLQAMRTNAPLRLFLLGTVAVAVKGGTLSPETLLAEFQNLLLLSLPRAAAPLVPLVMKAALGDAPDRAASAIAVVRSLKEDWIEVVQSQALRSLQNQLDSLAYELQKQPVANYDMRGVMAKQDPVTDGAQSSQAVRDSRQHLVALASICETLTGVQSRAQCRAREVTSALQGLKDMLTPMVPPLPGSTGKKQRASPEPDEYEAAMAAMCRKTVQGMQEGLSLLGLPSEPLHFLPGSELRVCGRDVREIVNDLLAHWVDDDKESFARDLERLREQLDERALKEPPPSSSPMLISSESQPGLPIARRPRGGRSDAQLLSEREALVTEREALLRRLRELDGRIANIDDELAQGSGSPGSARWSASLAGDLSAPPPEAVGTPAHPSSPKKTWPTEEFELARLAQGPAGAAMVGEMKRAVERAAEQLQQRRGQLLGSLAPHLEREQLEVAAMACSGVSVPALEAAWRGLRELCRRVQAACLGKGRELQSLGLVPVSLAAGTRCRARFVDGMFYDAEVQTVLSDGTVTVNWLRPLQDSHGTRAQAVPLRTVNEAGGDDSAHRTLQRSDVLLAAGGCGDAAELTSAFDFFACRRPQDLCCVDCGKQPAGWASVSFGVYLCRGCGEEHARLGDGQRCRGCLVRPLDDGWGWPRRDLECMKHGGNQALLDCLGGFPLARELPTERRYSCRWAEFYRRRLDAACTGAPRPQPPPPESAAAAGPCEFLSTCEAAAAAQQLMGQLESAISAAKGKRPLRAEMIPINSTWSV